MFQEYMKTKNISNKILLSLILFLFITLSLSKSYKQYAVSSLDGDVAESVLPYPAIQKIFDDPTGIKTIVNNHKHQGTNRFFSHYFLHKTFRELPILLQHFFDPINSVYQSIAITKLIIQILILFLLTVIISGKTNIFSFQFLISAAVLIPFFQTNGKYLAHEIGIIDKYVSYCFFYALPFIFLLIFYLPIFLEHLHQKIMKMNWFLVVMWIIFAIIACFSGPLNAPVILISNLILLLYQFFCNFQAYSSKSLIRKGLYALKSISLRNYLFIIPITILALYSTFLGTYNNHYEGLLTLKEIYLLLPKGIFKSFTTLSYIIFFALLISNYLIVYYKFNKDIQIKRIFGLYRFLIIFSLVYLLLLPLGGFRPYRPFILRYDTILPITVLSIITICYTSLFILRQLKTEKWTPSIKIIYPTVFLLLLIFFLLRNKTYVYNECEKTSLYLISNSKEDIVVLDNDCSVVGWEPLYLPEESKNYGELLYLWRITDKPKLYYNLLIPIEGLQ